MSTAAPGATRGRQSGRWRRARPAVLVAALVLLVAVAGVLALPRTGGGNLDPRSAEPGGARALAQILQQQGVDVVRVESVAAAVEAAGPRASVLVVDSTLLPPERLQALARTSADLVLVEPDGPVLSELAPALAPAGVEEPAVRPAECPDEHARAAGSTTAGGSLLRAAGGGTATVCFPDPADPDAGSYAVSSADGREVRVIGQRQVLTNEQLGETGNAALALRTLGGEPTLVWLMASPLDTAADEDVTVTDLLPDAVRWVALWLGVVAVLAILWRARRLGPLVEEPLPVVVRSAETAEGRAGLYRAAGARDRAAAVLRAAALRRLAPRLGLPGSASAEQVAAATARATGRSREQVEALLLGPPPTDPRGLVALADDLDALTDAALSPQPPPAPTRKVSSP